MLERATLDVLANAAEIGLPEAATVPASVYDPFLRPFIKKNVTRAVDAASARTRRNAGDHVLKLAFLTAHPHAPKGIDPNDDRAVAAAFAQLAIPYLPPAPPPRQEQAGGAYRVLAPEREAPEPIVAPPRRRKKLWPVTSALLGTILVGALGTTGVLAAPYFIPTPVESFRGTAFGKALGEPLTDAVANAPRTREAQARQVARAELLSPKVKKQIGNDASTSLERTLDLLPGAITSPEESTDDALRPLVASINDTNRALANAHVPALLHTYASGTQKRSVWITSYFVEGRFTISADDKPFHVARGRRLDSLNLLDSALYKGSLEDWAIVSLDHMEEELVQVYLAPLALHTSMGPEEYGPTDPSPRAELSRVAMTVVTEELHRVTHVTQAEAKELHGAIGARNASLQNLSKVGFAIEPSSRIWLRPTVLGGLERAKGRGGWEAKLASETLRLEGRMKVSAKPLAPVVAAIAEVEEDQFIGRLAEEARLGDNPLPTTKVKGFASARSFAIGAGQLALLARPNPTPRLAFWNLVRRATDRNSSDRSIARVVLLELFHSLGIETPGATYEDEISLAATQVMRLPVATIQSAANEAYVELFGHPVPPLVRTRQP